MLFKDEKEYARPDSKQTQEVKQGFDAGGEPPFFIG